MYYYTPEIEAGKIKLTTVSEVKVFLKLTYINMSKATKGLRGNWWYKLALLEPYVLITIT